MSDHSYNGSIRITFWRDSMTNYKNHIKIDGYFIAHTYNIYTHARIKKSYEQSNSKWNSKIELFVVSQVLFWIFEIVWHWSMELIFACTKLTTTTTAAASVALMTSIKSWKWSWKFQTKNISIHHLNPHLFYWLPTLYQNKQKKFTICERTSIEISPTETQRERDR